MKMSNLVLACGVVLIVAVIAWGFTVVDLPASYMACEGDVVDMDACTQAILGRTVFGAVLVAGGIIAAAVIAGALLIRNRGEK